jgi:hypothetical protein
MFPMKHPLNGRCCLPNLDIMLKVMRNLTSFPNKDLCHLQHMYSSWFVHATIHTNIFIKSLQFILLLCQSKYFPIEGQVCNPLCIRHFVFNEQLNNILAHLIFFPKNMLPHVYPLATHIMVL